MAFPAQIDSAGAGAHNCFTGGADGSMNAGYPGPFLDAANPNDRYVVLGDLVAFKLRCYRSTDAGNTFAEQDAGNAPAMANDIGSPKPGTFQLWCSCYDSANKIIYTVFWSTTFKIAIKPFKIGIGWQATVVSTLDYGFAANLQTAGAELLCEFRPSDNVVWMAYTQLAANPGDGPKIVGGKFTVGTSTWDVAVTALAGVLADGLGWQVAGMRRDSGGNIHVIGSNTTTGGPFGGLPAQLWHLVIHPNNSLSAVQIILTNISDGVHVQSFRNISVLFISLTDKLSFTFQNGPNALPASPPNGMYVARGQVSDAPVWQIESPLPLQLPLNNGGLFFLQGTITDAAADYVFYNYYTAGGNVANFAYIFDNGSGWSKEQVIGTIDTSGAGTYIAAGVCIPAVVGSWGLVFELTPTVPGTFGMGFWGGAGVIVGPANPKRPIIAIIPFPIKRCLTPRRSMGTRPELVHCIQPSPDGKLYVPVKGPLINRECC